MFNFSVLLCDVEKTQSILKGFLFEETSAFAIGRTYFFVEDSSTELEEKIKNEIESFEQ